MMGVEFFESQPFRDDKEELAAMSDDERLYNYFLYANFRYDQSPESLDGWGGMAGHSLSRGAVLSHIAGVLEEKGYPTMQVQNALNKVVHGNVL